MPPHHCCTPKNCTRLAVSAAQLGCWGAPAPTPAPAGLPLPLRGKGPAQRRGQPQKRTHASMYNQEGNRVAHHHASSPPYVQDPPTRSPKQQGWKQQVAPHTRPRASAYTRLGKAPACLLSAFPVLAARGQHSAASALTKGHQQQLCVPFPSHPPPLLLATTDPSPLITPAIEAVDCPARQGVGEQGPVRRREARGGPAPWLQGPA